MLHLTERHVATPHRPKYLQVADAIRTSIADGYVAPGEQLPSEADIATMVGVSKFVVRQGLDILRQEGSIFGRNGVRARAALAGATRTITADRYFAEDKRILNGEAPEGSAFTDGHGIDWSDYRVEIEIRRELATPKDQQMLRLEQGDYVWRRYFVKYAGEVPVEIQRSALPEFLVAGHEWLIDPARQPAPGGTQREMADADWRVTRIRQRTRARMAVENEQRDLRIAQVPVLDVERTFISGSTPVEASRLVLPAALHEVLDEIVLEA